MSLSKNTTLLQELLEQAQNLPNGSDVDAEIAVYTEELTEQDTTITQIKALLATKAAPPVESLDLELAEQQSLISQIQTALESKFGETGAASSEL